MLPTIESPALLDSSFDTAEWCLLPDIDTDIPDVFASDFSDQASLDENFINEILVFQ